MVQTAPLPRIALVATGGTIAGAAGSATQTVGYQAGALDVSTLLAAVPGLDGLAQLSAEQLYAIDSAHLTTSHWLTLARRVNELAAQDDVDGIVVLHGTDTLEETAYFLHLTYASDKPLVMTASMRPATATSADGPMNLYQAVGAAANPLCRGLGTVIAFGDTLLGARGVAKRDSIPAAFDADRYGRLGLAKGRDVFLYQRPARARGGFAVPDALPKVALLTAYADLDPSLIAAAGASADGLVFAGLGNGNLRPDWREALTWLASQGKAVVRASRVPNGTVIRDGEVADSTHGFVAGEGLSPVQARVLLMLGLTQSREAGVLQGMFDRY